MKYRILFIYILILLFTFQPIKQVVAQVTNTTPQNQQPSEDEYHLLEPLPIGNSGNLLETVEPGSTFGKYLNQIIKIVIGVVGVLSVVMIVLGGIQYMTTDAFSRKETGKEMITRSIGGLLIGLCSVLLLNTINPQLGAIVFDANSVSLVTQESWQDGTTTATPGTSQSSISSFKAAMYRSGMRDAGSICSQGSTTPDAQELSDLLSQATAVKNSGNFKDLTQLNVPVQASGKFTYKTLADKLASFTTSYGTGYTITEAWQPSYQHCAKCHPLGTCVDADFVGITNASKAQVEEFTSKARAAGLIAQFEVSSQTRFNELGIHDGSVVVYSGITGEHFSVYDKQ